MARKRKFSDAGVQHIFQISSNRGILFCNVQDFIVIFTLAMTKADHYGVKIHGMSIMINHFHIQGEFRSRQNMEDFMKALDWAFAFLHNKRYGCKGRVFKHSYGNAPKVKGKKITENCIYIANNPVPKKAASTAWDYRWNFLQYAKTGNDSEELVLMHPFSEKYDPTKASACLRRLVRIAKQRSKRGLPIGYDFFDTTSYQKLSVVERFQIIDIIISIYNRIDYSIIFDKWGSMEKFCFVLEQVSGSEYETGDDSENEDYHHYYQMIGIAAEEGYDMSKERIPADKIPSELMERLLPRFKKEANATELEIRKFFGLPKKR